MEAASRNEVGMPRRPERKKMKLTGICFHVATAIMAKAESK